MVGRNRESSPTEFDLLNSIHLHGMFFNVFRTGTSLQANEVTDTLMLCQGEGESGPAGARGALTGRSTRLLLHLELFGRRPVNQVPR